MAHPSKQHILDTYARIQSEQRTADDLGITRKKVRIALGRIPSRARQKPIMTPQITGYTLDEATDATALWQRVCDMQQRMRDQVQTRRQHQSITLPDEPCAIAFLSDLHIGNSTTDYITLKHDAEVIRDTPGMYAVFHGDSVDNWIIGKLQGQQHAQLARFDSELELFYDWLRILTQKLLCVVAGNHENWTYRLAHIDIVKQALRHTQVLYDRHQVVFDLQLGATRRRVKVRHKWRGNSVFNPTHALNVGWERGDTDFDWAIGGHTHIGCYCHDIHKHGKRRHLILTGTYKMDDEWGRELGFPQPHDRGCGAMVLHPDGREWFFRSLVEAAEFLAYLRSKR